MWLSDDLVERRKGVSYEGSIIADSDTKRTHNYDGVVGVVSHLGNNAVGVASRASTVHVGRGVNGGGVSDDAVSIPSRASTIVIGGDFLSRGDVGEGIHLRCRTRSRENERVRVMPLFIPSTPILQCKIMEHEVGCNFKSNCRN